MGHDWGTKFLTAIYRDYVIDYTLYIVHISIPVRLQVPSPQPNAKELEHHKTEYIFVNGVAGFVAYQ